MKLLVVFNHPAPYKVALFNGLTKHHDVHVIFERSKAKNRNCKFYNESSYKFSVHPIKGIKLGNENHFSFGVKNHLKKHHYDLIIMNGYSTLTEMIALRYLKKKNIPYAFYINGGIVKEDKNLKRRIKSYFISGATYYFSPAKKANEYLTFYGADETKIFNYPYSTVYSKDVLSTQTSSDKKSLYWQNVGIISENYTICVTSYIPRKNNITLIKGWINAPKTHALILVGDGKEKKQYEVLIKELKLTNVYLLPFASKSQVFEYLTHSDNAIYISNYDIYGHVINEALAHGLNVLTNTNMVAGVALIKDGKNGILLHGNEDYTLHLNRLFSSSFFNAAIESAETIEQSVAVHLELLEQLQ